MHITYPASTTLYTMSAILAQTDVKVVDSTTTLLPLLDDLTSLAIRLPLLYLDLDGVKLGRHGSISIISLHVATTKKLYLIDIQRLGKTAFLTRNSSATSLKTVFESPTMPKVIFDIRNCSNALFSHFQISVDGIKDLQLMELATRKGSKDLLAGLVKCIEQDSSVSIAAQAEWQGAQEGASRLYRHEKGDRYEIFNERPMRPEIVEYCARKVALLPGLYKTYHAKLNLPGEAFWQFQVKNATKEWIKLSQSASYDENAKTKASGPWTKGDIERAIWDWNEEIMSNALTHDDKDEDLDYFEDDRVTARDCIGWEEDMVKNGEYYF